MKKLQEEFSVANKISIAPMLDWTDRHFRYFMRLICRAPMFYTEMIAAPALILGQREKLLQYDPTEHPLTLQIGGSDPDMMAECTRMAHDWGYHGININAGCPSSRVQAGKFGAILMRTPELVADCVAEMCAASPLPVSVKTRISMADVGGDGFEQLFHFAETVKQAGCAHLIVHARMAKLNYSPEDNRKRLPLNYDVVYRLKKSFPDMPISINGNVVDTTEISTHLTHVNGVMIGRWAYGNPYALADIDRTFFGDNHPILSRIQILEKMIPYLEKNIDHLPLIATHMLGLFHGQPNARLYKQAMTSRDINTIISFLKDLSA